MPRHKPIFWHLPCSLLPLLLCARRPFIIKELDDQHLLVKEDMVEFVKEQVKAFNNKNVYTPPVPIE
jgi:hypothetical protein